MALAKLLRVETKRQIRQFLLAQHGCDFCHEEIVACTSLGASPVITYLPCFHAICQRCKSTHCQASNARANCNVPCSVCSCPFTSVQLYDLLIPASSCPRCNTKTRLECACSNCGGLAICFPCSVEHQRQSGHCIVPNGSLELPQRSQCCVHPTALATYHCSCGIQLCDPCRVGHAEQPGHTTTSYAALANVSKKRLTELQRMLAGDGPTLSSLIPQVVRSKEMVQERAAVARTAVANEVVEMCNAVIRRGNDIVREIDIAEDGKLKQLMRTEADLKFLSDRFQKLNFFLQMALASSPQQDMPGIVSAHVFADSAYNLIRLKRNQMPQPLRIPDTHLSYSSDAAHFIAAVRSYGQLNIDGVIKTPPSATQHDARMFTVTRGAPGPSSASRVPAHVHHHLPRMSSPPTGHLQQALASPMAGPSPLHPQHHQQQQYQHLLRQYSQQQMAAVPPQPMAVQRCNSTGEMADGRIMSPMSAPAGQNVPGSPLFPQHLLHHHQHQHQQPRTSHMANAMPNGADGSAEHYSGAMAALIQSTSSHGHINSCPSTSTAMSMSMAGAVNCAQSRTQRATPNLTSPPPHLIGGASGHLMPRQHPHQQNAGTSQQGALMFAQCATAASRVQNERPSGPSESGDAHAEPNSAASAACPDLSPINNNNSDNNDDVEGQQRTSTTESVIRTSADSTVVISPTAVGAKRAAAIISRPAKNEVFVTEGVPLADRSSRSEVPDSSDLHMRALSLFAASPERIASIYSGAERTVETVSARAQSADPLVGERNTKGERAGPQEEPIEQAMEVEEAAPEEDDRWDDYCYVCQEGVDDESGELGCCDGCPHVYHARCHVPAIGVAMKDLADDWKCSQCQAKGLRLTEPSPGFGEIEQLLCSTVVLCCFKEPDKVLHFRNDAVRLLVENASPSTCTPNAITFDDIARGISTKKYDQVENFIEEMNILFRSSSTKNTPSSSKALAGKYVYTLFINATRRYLPAYEKFIWNYSMLYRTSDEDPSCSLKIRIKRPRREEAPADLMAST